MSEKKYNTIQYLDRNESQYGPSPKCFEYLKTVKIDDISWYSRDFARGVKSKLSERIAKDFGFKESQIILSYGSEDILKSLIHRYIVRGDKVLIPKEAWWYYKKVAYEVGGFNVEYPMVKGEIDGVRSYLYDVDKMIQIYERERPRVVIIASPNNPTGNRITSEDLYRFLDACRGAIVMIDEAYWGFGSTDNSYVKPYIDEFPNLIICRTFSKYFALAGSRIGFSFAGNNLEDLK
ncbi:MAG TPA: aminotransferase class I/II-fold pyridoxal phosphate-dependent enzyme, partial [Ignavibacteria bacterium]|nr:aminotransferase class I/II-fold pyridoxal phosphate-dependent enzyme [Ignavibacteria bacterium]